MTHNRFGGRAVVMATELHFTESATGRKAGQQGCGGLEPDQRLARVNRSSTALVGSVLVGTSHASAGMNPKTVSDS